MAQDSDSHLTPAMRQFHRFKKQHPGCVLFFRMGDFYEMFYEDAKLAHRVLGVTLTQRTKGIPMAGVPYHAVEGYLRRMIQAGHRVAVCEQMETPAQADERAAGAEGAEGTGGAGGKGGKAVIRRDVTRVITPGTLTDETLLEEGDRNVLAAVVFHGPGTGTKGPRGQGTKEKAPSDPSIPGSLGPSIPASVSIAWAELSTGEFSVTALSADEVGDELARIAPRELLYCETATGEAPPRVADLARPIGCALTGRPAWQFRLNEAVEILERQYQVAQLAGFGFEADDPALIGAGAIVHYLLETQCAGNESTRGDANPSAPSPLTPHPSPLPHLQPPRRFERTEHLIVDQASMRSLEIERTLRGQDAKGSLLDLMLTNAGCTTAMGKRLLRQWLCYPLCDLASIEERQRVVEALVNDDRFLDELREALDAVHDVPRMIGRLAVGRASPRDLVSLGTSAAQVRALERALSARPSVKQRHDQLLEVVEPLEALADHIARACVESPPAHLREGGLIRDGFDAQLDEARSLQRDSHAWLARYQKELIEATDIPSLKVGYNKVFGYYIEVTASNKDKAAAYLASLEANAEAKTDPLGGWIRKQTLKNAERYITPELKTFEHKVLTAQSRAVAREQDLFTQLCAKAGQHIEPLRQFAQAAAQMDVLACFARRAVRHRYVKPRIVEPPVLHIRGGRHPVLDELLGDQFVPNDVELGARGQGVEGPRDQGTEKNSAPGPLGPSAPTLALITGPNMAGKSTYIRQAALLTLLAHAGSFVPADAAIIGLCDRIFTRIGASDELHAGQSTFMVEMTEAANICHHATARSLVILDEIGRGTSTLDGLSLAWAIAEHLAKEGTKGTRGQGAEGTRRQGDNEENDEASTSEHPKPQTPNPKPQNGPRTLFATHYHELTALAQHNPAIVNLNVCVREWQDQIVFLHRIEPGKADRSYGIHVAKLAGLPQAVIARADELLQELAVSHHASTSIGDLTSAGGNGASGETNAPHEDFQGQLPLFTEYVPHPAIEKLKQTDINHLSPLQAFDLLRELREEVRS